nr:hypothetical protein [Tanacetum cinerariifolium]
MLAPTFGQNQARITPIQDLVVIYESYDDLFTLKINHNGNFTSLPDRRYCYAVIEWIPRKSLDEGMVPLISYQDVLSLLKYVPRYKEIKVYVEKHTMKVVSSKGKGVVIEEIIEDDEVYVEKHTMKVVSSKGKGVVIEEIIEDDEVNEATKTGNKSQSLLLDENDVRTRNIYSTSKVDHPPWSSRSLYDSDISEHPPWSSESMNEKRNKSMNEKRNKRWSEEFWFRIQLFENDFAFGLDLSQDPRDMTKVVKAKQDMQEHVYYNFHPLMYDSDYDRSISGLEGDLKTWIDDDDLLQQVDPYDWQQDPYHGDDEAQENAELFAELDDLLEPVEERLEKIKHGVDGEIERPRKRKRENEDESASANERSNKRRKETYVMCQELIVRCQERREQMIEMQRFLSASNVVVESFKLLKELQDNELEKSKEMMLQSCYL